MKYGNIKAAEEAARRFLSTVEPAKQSLIGEWSVSQTIKNQHGIDEHTQIGTFKTTAACRRASMDLTRALSKMRTETR